MKTIEEKAEACDEMTRLLSDWYKDETDINIKDHIAAICPWLADSWNEMIRKELLSFIKSLEHSYLCGNDKRSKWITWLEQQGEQKQVEMSDEVWNGIESIAIHLEHMDCTDMADELRALRNKLISEV